MSTDSQHEPVRGQTAPEAVDFIHATKTVLIGQTWLTDRLLLKRTVDVE